MSFLRSFAILPAAALLALGAGGARAQAPIAGVWDLTWETRRGPERNGQLAIVQEGERLRAEIRGRGAVKAKGKASGSRFELRGSRMMVPYIIAGTVSGDRMTGSFKVMSVEKRFSGVRRR
jgi:hypothetical protein